MTETEDNIEWLQSLALARNDIAKAAIAYVYAVDHLPRRDQTERLNQLREAVRKAWVATVGSQPDGVGSR
jgi:hypothetical protein